jgi:hypothetical protein
LAGEKFIRLGKIRSDLNGGVIGTEFTEDNVECDSFSALLREFVNDTAINLARPVETETEAEGTVPDGAEAVFIDVYESEVGCDDRRELKGLASANVVGNAFQTFEKLQSKEAEQTDQKDDGQGDQTGDELERL